MTIASVLRGGAAPPARFTGRADPLVDAAAVALAVLFSLLILVGPPPWGAFQGDVDPSNRAAGNAMNQLAQLALVALALPILAARRDRAYAIIAGRSGVWIVLILCLVSAAWSDFPSITVRRAAAMALFALIALAISVGPSDLRRLHAALLASVGFVVLLNFGALAVAPGVAIGDAGVRGLHSSKNVAGFAMAIVIVCSASYAMGARRMAGAGLGLAVLLLAGGFLLMTQSKTSIGLTALVVGLGAPFAFALRADARIAAAGSLICVAAAAAAIAAIGAADWSRADLLTALFGDPTFTNRTPIWSFVVDEIGRRPLLGFGYGAFWDVGPENDPVLRAPLSNWLSQSEIGVINQAHNGFLDIAAQIGAPAAVAATLVVLRGVASAVGLLRKPVAAAEFGLASFAFLILATFIPHNMMESSLLSRAIPAGAFIFLALFITERVRIETDQVGARSR